MPDEPTIAPAAGMTTDSLSLREAAARLTHALAVCSDEQAAAVRTILHQGAGLLGLPEGAGLRHPAGLVPDRREAWCTLIDALRLDAVGVARDWDDAARWTPTWAGAWESVLASLLIEGNWAVIDRTARTARGEVVEPATGESSALSPDQVATLVELARADRREDYDSLCAALGVVKWVGAVGRHSAEVTMFAAVDARKHIEQNNG